MGHIAHLRKQFKSINTYDYIITRIKRRKKTLLTLWEFTFSSFEQNWILFIQKCFVLRLVEIGSVVLEKKIFKFHYFVIISTWKRAGPFIWTNLNPLHPSMLCAKFGWNWPCGSGEEDENVKSLRRQRRQRRRRQRRTTDKFWSEKLTWAFGSGELKRAVEIVDRKSECQDQFIMSQKRAGGKGHF